MLRTRLFISKWEYLNLILNLIYKYFKDHSEYDYLCIANNDIIIPTGALEELVRTHKKWPSVCIVPLTTANGSGHNHIQGIANHYDNVDESVESVQAMQDVILKFLNSNELKNRRFFFDPARMLMFNGFFFSFKRKIIDYERSDGNLFNPEFLNFKNEDDFNWNVLIANDEYPMLCKTSYIYHFKGKSFSHIQDPKTNDLNTFIKNRTNNI
jgi:GT2 family glycosyltransferase